MIYLFNVKFGNLTTFFYCGCHFLQLNCPYLLLATIFLALHRTSAGRPCRGNLVFGGQGPIYPQYIIPFTLYCTEISNVSRFYITEWPRRIVLFCLPPLSLYKMFRPSSPMQCDSRHKSCCKSL